MVKAGMVKEGELADDVRKDGVWHTMALYGVVRRDV